MPEAVGAKDKSRGAGGRREVEKLKVFFHLPLAPFHQLGPKA